MGEKKFRADQLWEWLWLKSARSFDQMTNLSLDFRAKLASEFSFPVMTIANTQRSSDGTIKYAFRLDDGFLRSEERRVGKECGLQWVRKR